MRASWRAALAGSLILVCAGCGVAASGPRDGSVTPNDPKYPQQWALPAASLPQAWNVATGSHAVKVAVIDSGVQAVPDLAANLGSSVRCAPGCADPVQDDRTGHGTAVASIIGSVGNNDIELAGVTWNVTMLPIQVDPAADSGTDAAAAGGIANGIRWANAQGARVVNISLVDRGRDSGIAEAIAASPNMLFVVPAGNDSRDVDARDLPAFPCVDPAPNVLCVAATDRSGALSPSSNFGATSVDLAAPGTDLLAAGRDGRAVFKSGTSFAAPMVSGAAALLLAARPDATVQQVKASLLCGAGANDQLTGRVGSGALNVVAAADLMTQSGGPPDAATCTN